MKDHHEKAKQKATAEQLNALVDIMHERLGVENVSREDLVSAIATAADELPDFSGQFESLAISVAASPNAKDPALMAQVDQLMRLAFDGTLKSQEGSRIAALTAAQNAYANYAAAESKETTETQEHAAESEKHPVKHVPDAQTATLASPGHADSITARRAGNIGHTPA